MPFNQHVPRPFTANMIHMYAPTASGVYGVSNSREWIYIGETADIQSALLAHAQNSDASLMEHQPTGFVFELCDGGSRPDRQDRLVREYAPKCNRLSER